MKKLLQLLLSLGLCVPTLYPIAANETKEGFLHTAQDIDYEAPVPSKSSVPFTKNNTLPSSYDSRTLGHVTAMENQGEFGTCWSYGVISSAETSLLKQGYLSNASSIDYSELQVAYGFYHRQNDPLYNTSSDIVQAGIAGTDGYLRAGGHTYMSAMYLSQWQSVMSEAQFPNVNHFKDLLEPYEYETINQANEVSYVMKEAVFLPQDTQAIKEAIIKYGSVVASYYSESESHPYIYNLTQNQTNHVITLVGYDDTISKEKFASSNSSGTLPSRDGAWIMRNSWGTGYGDKGYFYVSYDQYLGTIAAFDYMPKANQNLYYYDGGVGVSAANYTNQSEISYANVFEVAYSDAYTEEKLTAVNVGIGSASTTYEIQLYRLNPNPSSPTDGTALLSQPLTGQNTYAGLYTIPLKEAITLNQGEAISVVVTLKNNQSQPTIYVSATADLGTFLNISEVCEPNQSYYYDKDGWLDCKDAYESCARIKMITTTTKKNAQASKDVAKQTLTTYYNEYTWLSASMKQEVSALLSNGDDDAMQSMIKKVDAAKFKYDLLTKNAQSELQDKSEWMNGKEASELSSQQASQINQALQVLSQSLQRKDNYDDLQKTYQELNETYNNVIYSMYEQYGSNVMLGILIDQLDMVQYGEYSRYLTFSQLNEMYNISNTARNIYQYSYNETEYLQQIEIVKEALYKYERMAKENAKGCECLRDAVQSLGQAVLDATEALHFNRLKQKALAVAQKPYPLETYAAQYVKLSNFVRQASYQDVPKEEPEEEPVEPEEKAPSVVTNLVAKQDSYKAITLTWDESKDALSYDVFVKAYKEDSEYEFKTNVSETQTTISGLMSGKSYSFYVVAKNKVGDSEASEVVSFATQLTGTVSLSIEQVSKTKFTLSWNKIDGATRYIIYRKRNSDSYRKVLTLGGSDLSYTTSELPEGTYKFIVKAGRYDSIDRIMTEPSNDVTANSTYAQPEIKLTAGSKQIKVSWEKVEGVTHYDVYRATSSNGKYTKLKTTTSTSYTAKSLTKNKTYYFKVRGYKKYNEEKIYTAYSKVKSAKAL